MRLTACVGLLALGACMPRDGSDIESGALSYQMNCAICHGADARGAGPLGRDLVKLPPDLTSLSARHEGDFPFAYVLGVIEGHAREPGFSGAMPDFTGEGMGTGPVVDVQGVDRPVSAPMAGLLAYLRSVQM